jgi:hypothetical protein
MKHTLIAILLTFNSVFLFSQVVLTIEGTEVTDTETGTSYGVNVPRNQPTSFTFRNNSITSVNAVGYMLQAGDELPGMNNNNLDGEVIIGNKLIWNGTDETSMTHALFTGYNLDVIIKYNYLLRTPNGIQRKSNGMTDKSGVVAYNIINSPKVGIVVKGMNGVKIFNNTLYSDKTPDQAGGRGLIDIHTNTDGELNALSTGTKIYNNIFYSQNRILNIKVYESDCLEGFESDYNVFFCEAGEPLFELGGSTKTFAEWQALGYDLHSVIFNPDFNNFTDFVPGKRLDYGKNLGPVFIEGLSIDSQWGLTSPETAYQNGIWQVGARIYKGSDTEVYIWPNPTYDVINVLVADLSLPYRALKIYDINGRLVLTDVIDKGVNTYQIPEYLYPGIYNVSLEAHDKERYVRKVLFMTSNNKL